ncbi:unnamed protein product [Closterium sp. NIES-65]|nr:unnamed protein product [Closterium sp. NIES-65]
MWYDSPSSSFLFSSHECFFPFTRDQPPAVILNARLSTTRSLSYNELSGSIPASIGFLTSLTDLGLHSNKLSGAIPPSIALLQKINALDLSSNQLSGPIPEELGSMLALTKLSVTPIQHTSLHPFNLPCTPFCVQRSLVLASLPFPVYLLFRACRCPSDLSENQLLGNIPAALGALIQMEFL